MKYVFDYCLFYILCGFQCYDRLCQWDKMESVCHLLLSNSESNARDVPLELVWQQNYSQVVLLLVCVLALCVSWKKVSKSIGAFLESSCM